MLARGSIWVVGVALVGCAPRWESLQAPTRLLTPSADGRVAIVGRVVDDADRPVAGARVSLSCLCLEGPRQTRSGGDGSYRFTGLPGGTYTVELERSNLHKRVTVAGGTRLQMNLRSPGAR